MIKVQLKYGVRRYGSKIEDEYYTTYIDEYILEEPDSVQVIYMRNVINRELNIPSEDFKYLGLKEL